MADKTMPPAPLPRPGDAQAAHLQRVLALRDRIVAFLATDAEQDSAVALDALLNAYTVKAMDSGRYSQCGEALMNVGGQILFHHMQNQLAAGIDPNQPPTVH